MDKSDAKSAVCGEFRDRIGHPLEGPLLPSTQTTNIIMGSSKKDKKEKHKKHKKESRRRHESSSSESDSDNERKRYKSEKLVRRSTHHAE